MTMITPLCRLAYKYGTDKCPQIKHTYTPFYYELFKKSRKSIKKVLELGIGHYKGAKTYTKGASLYMWREFFPNAQIYGADIQHKNLFEDKRIKTFLCDEKKGEDLLNLIQNTGSDIDLFIDDASHYQYDQIFAVKTLMPLLKRNVTYIVEDASYSKKIVATLSEYVCWVPQIANQNASNQLVVVRNK